MQMKTISRTMLLVAVAAAAFAASVAPAAADAKPRNIVLFIGDGMSVPQRMVAEEFSRKAGNGALAMNALPHEAMVRTASASSLVTDSAAAATAMACGEKTVNNAVGVDAEGARLESCAEVAKREGLAVGIVTSVTINHATPAGFYAHQPNRSMLYEIGLDLVRSNFDLFLGGGLANANEMTNNVPENVGNLYSYAATNGWFVSNGPAGFERAAAASLDARVWWRSGEEALPYAIDVGQGDDTPRLPELTRVALDRLSRKTASSPKGFFLMVEGGRIDWAGHSNDAATNLRELLELDDAVKVALEFRESNPDTLIVIVGDHETGGMSLGFAGTGYAFYMERLAPQKTSIREFRSRLRDEREKLGDEFTLQYVLATIGDLFGLKESGDESDPMVLTEKELKSLERHFEKDDGIDDKVRRMMQERAGIGWTSGSHTGLPALATSVGPGSERFTGLMDNIDIAHIIKGFCRD